MNATNKEELAIAKRISDNKYNFIDAQGKLLFDKWFDWVGDFENGLARVQRERENPRFNYIDKEGKIISDEWFRWVDFFKDGFARVQREDYSYNLIDAKGNILSNEWFEWVDDFNEYDLAVVYRTNGECCKIDKTGKIVGLSK